MGETRSDRGRNSGSWVMRIACRPLSYKRVRAMECEIHRSEQVIVSRIRLVRDLGLLRSFPIAHQVHTTVHSTAAENLVIRIEVIKCARVRRHGPNQVWPGQFTVHTLWSSRYPVQIAHVAELM